MPFLPLRVTVSKINMSTTTTTKLTSHYPDSFTIGDNDSVSATFNYWNSDTSPKAAEVVEVFEGRSAHLKSVRCRVIDIRQHDPSSFNIDSHAFQILHNKSSLLPPQSSSIPDFHDAPLMKSTYWPELISLIKSQLGVRSAAAINTTVRDIVLTEDIGIKADNPRANPRQSFHPFHIVHGDYTASGARGHMRAMLPTFFDDLEYTDVTTLEERSEFFRLRSEIIAAENEAINAEGVEDQWQWSGQNYQGPRWAMLSVWRPMETVLRDPLAVLDIKSFTSGEREKPYAELIRPYKARPGFDPNYMSATLLPLAPEKGQEHTWYYLSEQKPEEVYALKLFDSEAHKQGSQVAECLPHSAFALPDQDDKPVRRSVEIRMMVIW